MSTILKELAKKLPADADISEVKFEASDIVLYTRNKEFFQNGEPAIKSIVRELKKRMELRPDLSITLDPEKTKEIVQQLVPAEAGIQAIYFEPELGKVIIECDKPGLVIGKGGETYREIKAKTCWLPKIERAPGMKSTVVRAVRNLLHSEIEYRKKFLNKVGQKIATEVDLSDDWARLSCLGASRQVGRSSFLLQTKHSNVMLDCGIVPGTGEFPLFNAPEYNLDNLDAVVLSHSHIDHGALIPFLYEQGFTGPMYATAPTRDTIVLLCLDYIDICQKNGKTPPYSKKAVEKMVKHSIALDYGEVSDITPDIRLTLQPAGHLLGSSLVHLHIGEGLHNILYTGDFKYGPTRLFDPAWTDFQRIETLVMESTYGSARDMLPPRQEVERSLMDLITRTVERGGKALVPSFAVGRGQEVMAILEAHNFQHPVWMEGMVWDATAIHTAYPEFLSQQMQRNIFRYGRNPFVNDMFKHVAPKERDGIIDSAEPGVIIATSGMLIGGPAIEYLKGLAPNPKNSLVFVGWQHPATLGSRIQKGWKEIPIEAPGGRMRGLKIEMEVGTIHGMTGHSGRQELVNFVRRLSSKPERIAVVHGDAKKCQELARDLHSYFRADAFAPRPMDAIRLK
ncbi:MAG: beta-CASP ribonuclease aCPSF1 [Candidatus Aenigmarchaeota archaeon]|nr:beta-CASP ribonuclease aCPSF1 [Candidatus Aenigmarchaeota archaeon]